MSSDGNPAIASVVPGRLEASGDEKAAVPDAEEGNPVLSGYSATEELAALTLGLWML